MGKALKIFWVVFWVCCLASPSWAYKEIEVKNGGTLHGKAILSGNLPELRLFHLILFPNLDMCAEMDTDEELNRVLHDFKVGPEMGLKDVVITIDHVDAGKPFIDEPVRIHSEFCKFTPDVSVIRQGATFTVSNEDAVMHNSQVYQSERGKIILNIPIPPQEISHGSIHFQKHYKIMQMICGMHEFMQTWGFRVQNPYHFITGLDGTFKIDQIPPGDYEVTAWHYLMKPRKAKFHMAENGMVNLDFDFSGSEVVRPLYETIKSGRISKDAAAPGTARGKERSRAGEKAQPKK